VCTGTLCNEAGHAQDAVAILALPRCLEVLKCVRSQRFAKSRQSREEWPSHGVGCGECVRLHRYIMSKQSGLPALGFLMPRISFCLLRASVQGQSTCCFGQVTTLGVTFIGQVTIHGVGAWQILLTSSPGAVCTFVC
jgi:hypothetical protein